MKRCLTGFSAIILAITMGALAVGCKDQEPPPPEEPMRWSPEQPQDPLGPAHEQQDEDR